MAYPKVRLTRAEITFLFETELLPFAEVVEIPASEGKRRWCRDPEDDKFIRCAKAGECAHLVSGDDDLLSLGRIGKMAILPPVEFLAMLDENGS